MLMEKKWTNEKKWANGKINMIDIYKYIDGVRTNSGILYGEDGKIIFENYLTIY